MFAYCGNNPVMGYDPMGNWDWAGVFVGVSIIVVTTIVIAVVGVTTTVGTVATVAALTTGAVITYLAAQDDTAVIDVSYSIQVTPNHYVKAGISFVIDFQDDTVNTYPHIGIGKGMGSGFGYSVGEVDNYDDPEDYAEHFVDINLGNNYGVDHCWNPLEPHGEATQATSFTFSLGHSFGIGYDYFFGPFQLLEW